MATDKQIEANRRNAQLCTGPRTEAGKARSARNALKTGLYAKSEVLTTENEEAYEELIAGFHNEFSPATPQEVSLVDALIRYEWLTRRYMTVEAAIYNRMMRFAPEPSPGAAFMQESRVFMRAGNHFLAMRRAFVQTLKQLEILQSRRKTGEIVATDEQEPEQIQHPEPELVSFRHPENSRHPEPEITTEIPESEPQIPPLAA